ncbi:porin family protein, partial [Methylobacterium sp. E-046]|nr:porin family protein [Methylobacterium sp. E-046]
TSLAAFTALTAAASAADLPRRAAPPPIFLPVPLCTWTDAFLWLNAPYAPDASRNDHHRHTLNRGPHPVAITPAGNLLVPQILTTGPPLTYASAQTEALPGLDLIGD